MRHGTGHGRRDPPGMGCGPSAVAGALARVTSGRRVEDGGAFPSRGAATLIGTASPVPLAADVRTRSLAVRLFVARNGYGAARHVRLLMCDKEAIEVQKILPFLSDTWPLCRIGRALGFGQVNLADKAVINLNVLPAGAVLIIAALMHHNFLDHFPQESGGQFFKGKVLADNAHKFLGVDGRYLYITF